MIGIKDELIKKYKKQKDIDEIYNDMRKSYAKIKSVEEKNKLKYELKDIISDSDRIGALTCEITLANGLLTKIVESSTQNICITVIVIFLFFAFITFSVLGIMKDYRLTNERLIDILESNKAILTKYGIDLVEKEFLIDTHLSSISKRNLVDKIIKDKNYIY